MKDEVYIKIYDRIAGWMPESHVILPDDRFEYLGLDSIDTAELVIWSEEEFNIEIADPEMDNIDTVGKFAQLIESKIALED